MINNTVPLFFEELDVLHYRHMEHDVLAWDAPEYHHFEKSADWFWVLGIVTAALVVISILLHNTLFAVFLALAATTLGIYAARAPRTVHFELQPNGIVIDGIMYRFADLESFWIDVDHMLPRIIVKSKKMLMPYIHISLGDHSVDEIRSYLLDFIPETHHDDSLMHKVFEYFGF